jgi:hypothetical protein
MSCEGIEPNPDISGIGVRTAIYAQAVLTLIQPTLAGLDGYISEDELTGLHELYSRGQAKSTNLVSRQIMDLQP